MSLVDTAREFARQTGYSCAFRLLEAENPAAYTDLIEACAEPRVGQDRERGLSDRAISDALFQDHHIQIGTAVISRHRNRECARCR